jgi:GNAT superfamily N-acetyltransferase
MTQKQPARRARSNRPEEPTHHVHHGAAATTDTEFERRARKARESGSGTYAHGVASGRPTARQAVPTLPGRTRCQAWTGECRYAHGMPDWVIRPATLDDRDASLALMDRAYGRDERRADLWDWAFADNPNTDELYYLVADTGAALAAQYATLPVAMQHHGRSIRGLISLFTATDPSFQRRGLFRTLAQELYDNTRETCPIVFGFPNELSAPGFYNHLDWVDLRPYPHLLRPLRNRGRHAGGTRATGLAGWLLDCLGRFGQDKTVTVRPIDDFTGIANGIWDALRPHLGTAVIRDESFLNWRFVRSPFKYLRLVATRRGKPVGIAVVAIEPGDGKVRLMEFMIAPGQPLSVTRTLLAHVIENATTSGAFGLGFVATRCHPQWKAMLAAGLLPTVRLSRHLSSMDGPPVSFGVRVNGPGVMPNQVLHIDDWHLSSADQDWL